MLTRVFVFWLLFFFLVMLCFMFLIFFFARFLKTLLTQFRKPRKG